MPLSLIINTNNTHKATIALLPRPRTHNHGWSHTHMYTQANPYHLFLPHLRNIAYHPFAPQLQPATDPQDQPRTEVD